MEAPALKAIIGDSRDMSMLPDSSIDLMVTSPPYWHIKDYGVEGQIGYGQTLHGYLKDLYLVWKECFRVLAPGRRACINVGDQFASARLYGSYKVIPLHAEVISQMETVGFDSMGSIVWEKRTRMNTSGGAVIMGSYPYPPNGMVEIDHEHILLFRKPGRSSRPDPAMKEASKMSKEEWKELHSGHWRFGGARQIGHEAMFPEELPSRLIRMFSIKGETVLDPFLGSGTTLRAAKAHHRSGIGFEINPGFIEIVLEKAGPGIEVVKAPPPVVPSIGYTPSIKDARPLSRVPAGSASHRDELPGKVVAVKDGPILVLDDGSEAAFFGITVVDGPGAVEYLESFVRGKTVLLRKEGGEGSFMVHLRNRIFVNGELVKRGHAKAVRSGGSRASARLMRIEERARKGKVRAHRS